MLDDWLVLRLEFERVMLVLGGARFELPKGENDWFRVWPMGLETGGDEVNAIDFGRPPCADGTGEGEGESLEKGLLRHLVLLVVDADIMLSRFLM